MRLRRRVIRRGFFPRRAVVLVVIAAGALFSARAFCQPDGKTNVASGQATEAQDGAKAGETEGAAEDGPIANPGRPTVSTPATLTPVGYLQFETGILAAWHSPEFATQASINEVIKFAVSRRIQFLAASEPFVHSNTQPTNGDGGVSLGVQGVLWPGEGARPTLSTSYFHAVQNGGTPDLDHGQRHEFGHPACPAPM